MNIMVHHPVRLKAPYYTSRQGAELHRYFEPEFINRFQRDLHRRQLADSALGRWKLEDAFSRFDTKPVLRLPMHKSFYLVSCEVVCDRPGKPALDPQKIASAGFVIRRLGSGGEYSWMLEDDTAVGWSLTPTGLRDPDLHRRFGQVQGKIRLRGATPPVEALTYTGEQTHPMHAVLSYDDQGKGHTILFGYLPLGGSYMLRQPTHQQTNQSNQYATLFDAGSLNQFSSISARLLPWPFGFKPAFGRTSADQTWTSECARPVNKAVPSPSFFELLKTLVNRYHLGEAKVSDNSALETWAARQYFYLESINSQLTPSNFNDYNRAGFNNARRITLGAWLSSQFAQNSAPLVDYMAQQENRQEAQLSLQSLPGLSNYSLFITPADAQELRDLLDQRMLNLATGKGKEIPLPKFGQERLDVYQVVPFVRVRNACGSEDIIWGDVQSRSEVFRVAAPFDPNASRPSLIQMPSLADLRKGMAQGVSMLTPPDTFGLLNALNLKKGASEDVLPGEVPPSLGIQWICSFSLPVITLVAMILLMIMISLLNIVFFWLPWVRICLPFPSIKKD